jgi:MYXO-CTERM domain-containing protein
MTKRALLCIASVAVVSLAGGRVRADDGTGTSPVGSDFSLTLARTDGAGKATVLTSAELARYFSVARCACPSSVVAGLSVGSAGAAKLSGHVVDAQLMVGADCNVATATACVAVGGVVTLSSTKTSTSTSVTTDAIFSAAGRSTCAASTTSTRLWAIVRVDGTRLDTEPSLALTLGGAGPAAPTAVKVKAADGGLLVTWTPSDDASALQGHQVLCSPAPADAPDPAFETCGAVASGGDTGPFASLDAAFVCSKLVAAGTGSTRVHGLENGRAYQIAVVAVGVDGTPSAPSAAVEGTPAPTVGFMDLYQQGGGAAQGGCAVGGGAGGPGAAALAVVALALARRRRRSAAVLLVGAALVGAPRRARAGDAAAWLSAPVEEPAPRASPRAWNLELRVGPYRPDVDHEFAEQGAGARPYEQLFGSSRRLMYQLELDRQLSHRGGTWALGLGVGYFKVSADALSGDLSARSGDETALRLIPLSAALVYRADLLRERAGSPLVPYAKLGLDCTLWRASDTSQANVDGRTFGWHAAAGVTLDLASLDPEAARAMDRESGVNQTALFFEAARYSLDGFGTGRSLRVGDTTWFAGLMLEL